MELLTGSPARGPPAEQPRALRPSPAAAEPSPAARVDMLGGCQSSDAWEACGRGAAHPGSREVTVREWWGGLAAQMALCPR